MDLKETECEGMDWMQLAQNRETVAGSVNTVMNLRVLWLSVWLISFLRRTLPHGMSYLVR